MQEAKEGAPTKGERETAWQAGFDDATDGKPPREDWPDPATAGDYHSGHRDGLAAVAQAEAQEEEEAEACAAATLAYARKKAAREDAWGQGYSDGGEGRPPSFSGDDDDALPDYEAGHADGLEDYEAAKRDRALHLRGAFVTLENRFDRLAGDIAEHVASKTGEAVVDIAENLCVTFRAMWKAIDRGDGSDAVFALRDTLRQVDTIEAARTATALPPGRAATRAGLARQIGRKRAQLAKMGRDLLKVVPPAFLDEAGGDLWTAMESAGSVTDPRAAAWRIVRRELDALVHAWDVL